MTARGETTDDFEKEMREYFHDLQRILPIILQQQEESLARGLPTPPQHSAEDRMILRNDPNFRIRRFMNIATPSTASIRTPQTPSFRISTLRATSSGQVSRYYTPPLSISIKFNDSETRYTVQSAFNGMWKLLPYVHGVSGSRSELRDFFQIWNKLLGKHLRDKVQQQAALQKWYMVTIAFLDRLGLSESQARLYTPTEHATSRREIRAPVI